jgi:site-specific recombinase XerD
MTKIRLKYVKRYKDRHGRVRHYFRRPGCSQVPLPGLPGSLEFMDAYQAALGAGPAPKHPKAGAGSFGRLVLDYFQAAPFTNLKASSQATYRFALAPLVKKHGHEKVAGLTRRAAEKIISDIGKTKPGMANLTRAVLRKVMAYAIKLDLRRDNPMDGVDAYKGGSHHTWTDDELAAYEARWAIGTRERLAFDLLLYTDQRVGDVARMRRQDMKGSKIKCTQEKTGAEVVIEIHPTLARSIKAYPAKGMTLIGDENGRQLSRHGLSRLVVRAATDAGLPKRCVPHGIRKAMQRLLSEHGATTKENQAVSGHTTLKESERYTEAANRARLFASAIAKIPDRDL